MIQCTSKVPLHDSEGNVIGILGTYEDITERKLMEEELKKHRNHLEQLVKERTAELIKTNEQLQKEISERKRAEMQMWESQEKYSTIFEQAADSIVLIDTETGALVEFNEKAHNNLGYTRKEFERLKIPDFEVIESAEQVARHIEKIVKEGGDIFETKHRTKSGEIQDIQVSSRAISIRGRIFVQSIWRDITSRKQAEEMLRESEEEKSLILNSMSERVSYRDSEMRIIWANKKAGEAANQAPEELIGRYCYEIWHQRNTPCIGCPILQTLKTGKTHESEIIEPDGKIWLVRGYSLKDDKGKVVGVVEFSYDITELKKAEEQIKASLKEKKILLQEIHHRVRNNMQVVSSLLKLQAGKMKDEKAREAFKESQRRVMAMALVHEALYRSDSMAEIRLQKHIPALVDSIYRTFRIKHKVELHVDVEDIKLGIGQATPLSLVINELISNSLKHAFPEGKGEIVVKVRSSRDDEIEVVVRDNGRGMPEDIDSDRTLGLQLVTGLVESQLDGTWEVIGEEGTQHTIRFKKK